MKKWLPWIIVGVFAIWLVGTLVVPSDKDFAYTLFGRLPVVSNGRVQPFDSLARNTLLQLREKQTAILEPWSDHPKIIPATEWLLAVMTRPEQADTWPEFRIDNPQLKGLLGVPMDADLPHQFDGKHFSWVQIQPKLADLAREAERANGVEDSRKNSFDQAVLRLWNAQSLYNRLKVTFGPAAGGDLLADFGPYFDKVRAGVTANEAESKNQSFDESALVWIKEQAEAPLVVPPPAGQSADKWLRTLDSVMLTGPMAGPPDYSLRAFNDLAKASRAGDAAGFNKAVAGYAQQLKDHGFSKELTKARAEQYFNFIEPFYKAMVIYVVAFLLVLAYWFRPGEWEWLRVTAVGLAILALTVHTEGLLFRMILEGRPPVTNLYSSAIFIGWGATVLGLVLEKFWRNSIGIMVSCIIGFLTLIIAHHLRAQGDTMEMMRAVLDTNFWLATHVVVVTLGYASTYVAGVLGVIYIIMGVFTTKLSAPLAKGNSVVTEKARPAVATGDTFGKSLNRMIYGIICFATLFSFVGTVLGGIWADQSWGRFWGWDPKENGALIIVLWNALVLHARWGGLVRERGLANMAVAGNIVTSWSWFGVNMLGIGLHSYGFTSAAFYWLILFGGTQLVLIALGSLPKPMWRSFQSPARPSVPPKSAPAAA
jgi:cytochrome c-type biogenesis protein CcsB